MRSLAILSKWDQTLYNYDLLDTEFDGELTLPDTNSLFHLLSDHSDTFSNNGR